MQFFVFRRADSALIVVPSLFQPPLATQSSGELVRMGTCDIDLDTLSSTLSFQLGSQGYAVIEGADWAALQVALQLAKQADRAPDEVPTGSG